MAIYTIESAMNHYNIKNNNITDLEKKILKKEDFVGVITYYELDFKTVDRMIIYTDKKSFDKEREFCLEIDYPFRHGVFQDRANQRERSFLHDW